MKERWKKVENHETYEISNLGRLRNSRGMILKPMFIAGGLATTLCEKDVKTAVRFSRLVGNAFCPSFRKDRYPIYKDGDNRNCAASNLKWVPRSKVCKPPYSVNPRKGREKQ
jgi:NUMOD4 motif